MRARAGGQDHVAFAGIKDADGMFGHLARLRSKSRIERGLSATSLVSREVHIHTCLAEHIHHRFADLRKKCIHKTSDEELHGAHGLIVVQNTTMSLRGGGFPPKQSPR